MSEEEHTIRLDAKSMKSPSKSSLVTDLRKQRGTIKCRLTLFEKYITKIKNVPMMELNQIEELKLRTQSAANFFCEFNKIQSLIEQSSSDIESAVLEREQFEELYYKTMATAKCLFNNIEPSQDGSSRCDARVKLPDIRLPTFDGSFDNWLEYRNSFVTMIHNRTDLDLIHKFHYLKSSLTNCALQVISALEFTAENYLHAWQLIENRFNNNRLLVHNHVKSLFTIPCIQKESSAKLRKLIDSILRNLRSLNTLGEPTGEWDTLIIYLIVSKLDSSTEREWEHHISLISASTNDKNYKIKLNDLLKFLRDRADMLEMVKLNSKSNDTFPKQSHTKPSSNNIHSYVATQKSKPKTERTASTCLLCNTNHALYICTRFLNFSVQDRIKFVTEHNLCRNCLRLGHKYTECLFRNCKQCSEKHNSLLHVDNHSSQSFPITQETNVACTNSLIYNNNSIASNAPGKEAKLAANSKQVLLSTALVQISADNNKFITVRALLDSGSQRCIITQSLCDKLNASYLQSTINITGVGQIATTSSKSCDILIKSLLNDYNKRIRCLVLPNITHNLPPINLNVTSMNIPADITLADPDFLISSRIDLLIGADLFWDLLTDGRFKLPTGPYLQNTQFGWVISGSVYTNMCTNLYVPNYTITDTDTINELNENINCHLIQSVDVQLRKFWELEEINNNNHSLLTVDERRCEDIFINTTEREPDGRFLVRIPLKQSPDQLGDTYTLAKNRFMSLERKLQRSATYNKLYCDFMTEYIQLGHMSPINNYTKPFYILPHHGVLREQSTTTKLRVVFNASARSDSGVSLNDLQYTGPSLHVDSFSLLLRFRQHTYVAMADIEKMFRQINIQMDQRHLQLIIWRDNPSKPLQLFQLNTVTYGTASAPYLSMRCLRQLAQECGDDVVASVINQDMFVDDLITGHDDKQTLLSICDKVAQVLLAGRFPLRKWTFNTNITGDSNISKQLNLGEHCQSKTLGLGWYSDSDQLHFVSKIDEYVKPVTKRIILSVVSQIYDPLGLLSPVIVVAKVLLQKLWLCKAGWDDPVPDHIITSWNNFTLSLKALGSLRVPRHVVRSKLCELHIFTDASQSAYGACAYVSSCDDADGTVAVRLLCAKSKVAPLKILTIPRLELCGALVGARLYNKIVNSVSLSFVNTYFWTDSTIVLGWLRMPPSSLKTFVQNRAVEINELCGNAQWHHIDGTDNPADILSRGATLSMIQNNDLWWSGPAFLHQCTKTWPSEAQIIDCGSDLPEVKESAVALVGQGLPLPKSTCDLIDFDRFSSFNRLQRATAYVLRFIHNIRNKIKNNKLSGPLAVNELNSALTILTRFAQMQSFPDEYRNLKSNLTFKSNRNLSGLDLFMDKDYLIRVGGRLENSSFEYDKRHPLLLSGKTRFSQLLFEKEHVRLLHGGPQLLLSSVRERWWVLRGRDLARRVVRRCVTCTRFTSSNITPKMGHLPAQRLEPSFPFFRCGVDYAGPMLMLNRRGRGAKLEKCYVCLFVCFVTRAIHLELVTCLSTEGYLLALKRFISRRGQPQEIFSDNGRNFVGAMNELAALIKNNKSQLIEYTANQNIKFHFIPTYAPHFGGLWEAGVRSCKHHLRRVMGNAHLTYEQFSTVLSQIEAILNSRPLTPLSSDINDLSPLSPAHFLVGRSLTAPACPDVSSVPASRLSHYQRVEQLRQHFWVRWSKEFVSELQQRSKWRTGTESLQLGTLVLIKEDLPPLKWKLGRIIKIYPGVDGVARVADIRTANGIIRRAFNRICPLPIDIIPDYSRLEAGASKVAGMSNN